MSGRMDDLHRVRLPQPFCDQLGLTPGDEVEVSLYGDAIEIRKHKTMSDYDSGQWDMFQLIASAQYGKRRYFVQDDGQVYDRDTDTYFKDMNAAVNAYLREI